MACSCHFLLLTELQLALGFRVHVGYRRGVGVRETERWKSHRDKGLGLPGDLEHGNNHQRFIEQLLGPRDQPRLRGWNNEQNKPPCLL